MALTKITSKVLSNTAITGGLGYTPANKAGDVFTGAVTVNAIATVGNGGGTSLVINDALESAKWSLGNGGYGLHFAKNNGSGTYTDMMLLDGSGRLTLSQQPAFIAAAKAGTSTYISGAKVLYDNIQYNRGNNYSATNSRFTAPVAGVYMFKAQVWSYSTNPSATRFGVNGTSVWGSYGNEATQIGFNGYALVEIFYLGVNDYVEVFNRLGTTYTDGGYSLFSGVLLG